MKLIKHIWILWLCCSLHATAQQATSITEYIDKYKLLAIEEMQRTGVPASIKLAQGIHETMAGTSELVLKSNNHFGIKCKTGWSGEKVYHDDDESGECFRSYAKAEDSYRDHSDFLKRSSRYAFLFQLNPEDYKAWAYGLKKAGYATNIKYSQILIKLIETHHLQEYTLAAMQKNIPADILANKEVVEEQDSITSVSHLKREIVLPAPAYPGHPFELNQTKVIFVKAGTSLLSVAEANQLPLSRLLDFNDITADEGDILLKDQLIYLQRKKKQGARPYHVVQPGEQMYDIAQVEGVRYETVLEYNHLKEGMEPAVGEKIYLQSMAAYRPQLNNEKGGVAATMPLPSNTKAQTAASITHLVQPKETLYSISKKYDITVEHIMKWNKMENRELRIGQQLTIYKN